MRLFFIFCLVFFVYFPFSIEAQDFKVVGYYPFNGAIKSDTSKVPFNKLTHIPLHFINPDVHGNFNQNFEALGPFITAAHRHNVKVLYSLGGGGTPPEWHALISGREVRQRLINNLVSKVVETNADGIDVDLEAGYVFRGTDPNYGIFIKELAQALRSHNKLITVALPGRNLTDVVTSDVLAEFDFINIMSYDHTSWRRPDRPGNHASYIDAMDDLDYYRFTLNIPKEKLILGVPFYGRGFGPELTDPVIAYMNYESIVDTYPGAEWVDHWHFPNGYIMYYNGIPTIQNKTRFARKEAGGIMIWEVTYDVPDGPKSLLNAINSAARQN